MAARIKYEEVQQNIESQNWQLISTEYKNLDSDLELKCPQGHECHFTYKQWRKGVDCPVCSFQPIKKINEKPIKKTGYRILAFDQASITSGWSCFDNQNLINYGKWTSNGFKSTARISQTKAWIASMIQSFKPDEVIFEDIQLQKFNGNEAVVTYKKLAHLQGVLKNYCYENSITYSIIAPGTWRTYSNIKGRSRTDQKRSAQNKVQQLYGIDVSNDIADAILIGRCAASAHKQNEIIIF